MTAFDIANWNKENRIGTTVRYWKDDLVGPGLISKIRSHATVIGNIPVVYLDGVVQAIPLTHILVSSDLPRRKIVVPKREFLSL